MFTSKKFGVTWKCFREERRERRLANAQSPWLCPTTHILRGYTQELTVTHIEANYLLDTINNIFPPVGVVYLNARTELRVDENE
jgi:hypothetical protein